MYGFMPFHNISKPTSRRHGGDSPIRIRSRWDQRNTIKRMPPRIFSWQWCCSAAPTFP